MCRRGRDRMVVGYSTTYATSAYHQQSCKFECHSTRGVFNTTFSELRQVCGFLRVFRFPPPIKLTVTI